jgi:YD repeat-containing protein
MRARGLSNSRCWSCITPTRAATPLGASTSPLPSSEPAFPYVARPGASGLVVRLPRWAAGAPQMPPWGVLSPARRAIRMGAGPPPMDWLPFNMDTPWAPGHLYGEHGGQSPTLDDGPAWWHLYPPPEAICGPFEPPTRPLRLGAVLVARPLRSQPWSWGGANYPVSRAQPAGSHAVLTAVRTPHGVVLRPRLMGVGQVPPPLPPEATAVVGVPGATPQIDSSGNVVGWYRVNPDGTTTMYDAQGNLVESTGTVINGAGPLPGRAPAAKPFDWTTILYIGGAGAGLFLLMALLQKR